MRDVNYGWLLRYMHANGASMFFFAVYIHMFRGIYYGSYKAPREVLWILGVIIYPADDGHRLHGLRAALGPDELLGRHRHHQPVLGHSAGRRRHHASGCGAAIAVDNPTLNRFFALHYLLPFMIVARRRPARLGAACVRPEQSGRRRGQGRRQGHRALHAATATIKDASASRCSCSSTAWFVFYIPNYLGDADNYIPANPLVTPPHIVPEWYFLPFYAILRSIPNKLAGVIAMFARDRPARLPALARHLEGALGQISADLQDLLLDLRGLRASASAISVRMPSGRRLCPGGADSRRRLFRLLPDRSAAARPVREDQAGAGLDRRRGARQERVRFIGRGGRRLRSADQGLNGRFRGTQTMALTRNSDLLAAAVLGAVAFSAQAPARRGGRSAEAAEPDAPELVLLRPVRHVRSGAAAARLQGLQGSLLELPWAAHSVPHARRAGRAGLHAKNRSRLWPRPIQVHDGPNDKGEMFERPGRPSDYFPPPLPQSGSRRGRASARRRRTCRCSPSRSNTSAVSPTSSSTPCRFRGRHVSGIGAGLYLRAS